MKYFKGIMEGEGIVGFRPISVTTTPLLSCLAIGMAHSKSYQFGLYHYPALTLGTPGVDQVITAMINAIKP